MYKAYAEHVNNFRQSNKTSKAKTTTGNVDSKPKTEETPDSVKTARKEGVKSLQRHESTVGKDVMISYSHQNRPLMRKIKG